MPEFPDWTEFCSGEVEHRGLDPLGLEAVGAGIVQRDLLPGITNATRHIRYYSFFCWVFWKFWSRKIDRPRLSQQRLWRMRLENVLRAATLEKDCQIGALVGVTKAIRIHGLPATEKVSIDGGKAATAFVPANYSSSFRALGCGRWDEKKGGQLTTFGERLALAWDESFDAPGRLALKEICSDANEVSAGSIRSVANTICLRPVNPSEPEHKLLLELLFRIDDADYRLNASYDMARSRSLGLFMEIADQAHGSLTSPSELHRIFATMQLPNRAAFVVPTAFKHTLEVWRRYQERQYVKLAIYALWHELVQMLQYRPFKTASSQNLLTHFDLALRKSEIAERWLGESFCEMTVGAALQMLIQRLRLKPESFGKRAIAFAEDLMNLDTSTADRVGTAIVLLLLCSCYWKANGGSLAESQFHKAGGAERLSLETVHKDCGRLTDVTAPAYLQWALENYVLKQATRVATQKLPDYRFFIIRDEEGYRLRKRQNPYAYLSYDSSRIGSAFELLADLQLVRMSGKITLTAVGHNVLQRVKAFHETISENAYKNGATTIRG